jgi:hypothetical protein
LFVTLLFIAASPWLIPFFVKTFHSKGAELFELKIEILEGKLQEESRRLDQLFLLSMGKHAFNHMEKLALPQGFGSFSVSPPFERELGILFRKTRISAAFLLPSSHVFSTLFSCPSSVA